MSDAQMRALIALAMGHVKTDSYRNYLVHFGRLLMRLMVKRITRAHVLQALQSLNLDLTTPVACDKLRLTWGTSLQATKN